MRGMIRRISRLKLVAGLGIALAMPVLSVVTLNAQAATTTTLKAGTLTGCAQALVISVTANGQSPSGAVAIEDEFNSNQVQLGTAPVSAGSASPTISLATGNHVLTAVFLGDSSFQTSTSATLAVSVTDQCAFMTAVSYLAPVSNPVNNLTPGQSGTATVSVVVDPGLTAALTAPVFVTLSCSGLPDESTCNFTPGTIEVLPNATAAVTSSMVIVTQEVTPPTSSIPRSNSVAWAFLLPGALGLGGLAWGTRRRAWLNRLSLLALVALVTILGATACSPRYDYYNHGPPNPPATPAGTYTVLITAQTSNGIVATTQTTNLALTIQ